MERFFTAFVLGLCAAPLFFIITLKLIDFIGGYLAPGQGPNLSSSLFLAIVLVIFGFVLVGSLAWFLAGRGYLRPVQSVTGLMLAGWSLAWAVFAWKEPRSLDYRGQQGILDVEIRVAKSLLDSKPPAEVLIPSFLGGNFDQSHPEHIREEGGFLILPWETTVMMVYKWAIWVKILNSQQSYFPLNLPYRPTQSTNWSAWGAPMPHEGATTPAGLTIRYRFRLIPELANLP